MGVELSQGPGNEPTKVPPPKAPPKLVTPELLARRFGTEGSRRDDAARMTVHTGFCGLLVIGARDRMISGFDDGYDFMGYLEERGWHALASKGNWPYVVYLTYQPREPYAVASYCECDFTLYVYDDAAAAIAHIKTLPEQA